VTNPLFKAASVGSTFGAPCTADGQVGCVSTTGFPAADAANLSPGNIKAQVVIGGVTGRYPSAAYPLPGAGGGGISADLTVGVFDAYIKSSASFQWYDASGQRYTGSGDGNITAANIAKDISIFGTVGSYGGPCAADGQVGCLTTSVYKSADTSQLSAWDIRAGKSAAGISGRIAFYKNGADLTRFDRATGAGGIVGLDIYDTLDDFNGGGAFPSQVNTGWPIGGGSNWLRDPVSDTGDGAGGIASDGLCNGTEKCVYKDQTSGQYWAQSDAVTRDWEGTIAYCDALDYGGYSDWRVPTLKEAMQAHIDEIARLSAASMLNLTSGDYWTATTRSSLTTWAWVTTLVVGPSTKYLKTALNGVLCTRP
jgi:hypothetical protein